MSLDLTTQFAEQVTENPRVGGLILPLGTIANPWLSS